MSVIETEPKNIEPKRYCKGVSAAPAGANAFSAKDKTVTVCKE